MERHAYQSHLLPYLEELEMDHQFKISRSPLISFKASTKYLFNLDLLNLVGRKIEKPLNYLQTFFLTIVIFKK